MLVQAGKTVTITKVNDAKRSITSLFVNQSAEAVEVTDETFTLADSGNFLESNDTAFRRVKANVAFIGVAYSDLTNLFGIPKDKAVEVAENMNTEREAKQKELYG